MPFVVLVFLSKLYNLLQLIYETSTCSLHLRNHPFIFFSPHSTSLLCSVYETCNYNPLPSGYPTLRR